MRKHESGWRIPENPLPQEWQTICLTWPKDDGWESLLKSLIFHLTRGRSWDKDSGVITDAQQTGWEVFDRNIPLVACVPFVDYVPTPPDVIYLGSGSTESEDSDMGQVVTEVLFDAATSELVVKYGHCCEERFKLGVATSSGDIGDALDDNVGGEDDPFSQYYPCGAADGIVQCILDVAQAIMDHRLAPWLWVKSAQDAAGFDLDDYWVIQAGMAAVAIDIIEIIEETSPFNEYKWARIKCLLANRLDDQTPELTKDDFNWLMTTVGLEFLDLGEAASASVFILAVISACGTEVLRKRGMLGALNADAVCDCPTAPYAWNTFDRPSPSGYYVGPVIVPTLTATSGETSVYIDQTWIAIEDIFGFVFEDFSGWSPADGVGILKRMDLPDHPHSWFQNSSDTLEDDGFGRWGFCAPEVAMELGCQFTKSVQAPVGTPTEPLITPGIEVGFRFELHESTSAIHTATFRGLRPIYNVNSPSHEGVPPA